MAAMRPIPLLVALVLALAAPVGCGDGEESEPGEGQKDRSSPEEIAGDADPEAVEVISTWSKALRRGDIDAAAALFAIPSVAENGPILVRIESEAEARLFNESLPCGGRLIQADTAGEFTTATFRLTERPGPGSCGAGTGQTARTSFVIRDDEIVEWRRVDGGQPSAPGRVT
jgi:limonene-1,2-epoxide hydrolase